MTHHNLSIQRQKCHQLFMAPSSYHVCAGGDYTSSRLENKLQENMEVLWYIVTYFSSLFVCLLHLGIRK